MQTDDRASDEEALDLDDQPISDERPFLNARWQDPRLTVLREHLRGKSEEYRARVYDIVELYDIDPNDPMFLMLLATHRIDIEVGQLPNQLATYKLQLESVFDQWSDKVTNHLDAYQHTVIQKMDADRKAAISVHEKQMGQMVSALIGKVTVKQAVDELLKNSKVAFLGFAGVAVTLLAATGFGAALSYYYWQSKIQYEPGNPRRLTVEQAKSLQWAQSDEGRYAKNLIEWNRPLLADRACVDQAKRSNVNVQVDASGEQAKSGFCLLWIDPPAQRQFAEPSKK